MWFGDGRGMQEASEDGGQIEAAIETVLNFGEIAMSVFGEIERKAFIRRPSEADPTR